MKWIRNILFPIVPIYYLVTLLRNWLYDKEIKPSKSYDFPVLCVGNLSVGGTGKTPVIEYLIRLLKRDFKVATLSRGYRRTSNGFVLADETASALKIGDEPFQFYTKFKNEIAVAVDANRQNGIGQLRIQESPEVILLDDAFQHRKVKAGLSILLTVFDQLYVDDWMLPMGNLREPVSGAERANIVIVTKCPSGLTVHDKERVEKKLGLKTNQQLFFSHISYSDTVLGETHSYKLETLIGKKVAVVTGIAHPKPFIDYLKSIGLEFEHLDFPDHHVFGKKDIEEIGKRDLILTTEKDYMRLKVQSSLSNKLYYLPIAFKIDNASDFDNLVKKFVAT